MAERALVLYLVYLALAFGPVVALLLGLAARVLALADVVESLEVPGIVDMLIARFAMGSRYRELESLRAGSALCAPSPGTAS